MSKKKGLRCFPFFYFSTKCHLSSNAALKYSALLLLFFLQCGIKIPHSFASVFLKGPESFRGPFGLVCQTRSVPLRLFSLRLFSLCLFQSFIQCGIKIPHSFANVFHKGPESFRGRLEKFVLRNLFPLQLFSLRLFPLQLFQSFILNLFPQNLSINFFAC